MAESGATLFQSSDFGVGEISPVVVHYPTRRVIVVSGSFIYYICWKTSVKVVPLLLEFGQGFFWCEDGHARSKSGNKEESAISPQRQPPDARNACCPVYLRACLILCLLFWGSKRRCLWSTGGVTVGVCCPVMPCSHLTRRHELFISLLHLENTIVSTGPSKRLQLWGEVFTCLSGVLDNQTRPRSPLPE